MRLWAFVSALLLLVPVWAQDHQDLLAQFGPATTPRTWDEAYALAGLLVGQLTTDEKKRLTTGTGIMAGPCSGNVKSIDRLNFPYLCLNDGPTAVRNVDYVTVFPAGITTGATWDRELMYLRSRALGVENRLKGIHVSLSPVAGTIGRSPNAGRTWEGFSPDPYLAGVGNAQSVLGLQDERVQACTKHWIANEQEHYRLVLESITYAPIVESIDEQVDERTLKELYAWPFIDAVAAGSTSVMCAYNRVNGAYACESDELFQALKGNSSVGGLGFRGFVVSDWFAEATGSDAAKAGLDMSMPGDLGALGNAGANLPASDGALKTGTRLDEMATRIVAGYYKVHQEASFPNSSFSSWNDDEYGIFLDRGFGVRKINFGVKANASLHEQVARRIAAEGIVLVKNTNSALPLGGGIKIGVFGSDAGPIPPNAGSCGDYGADCTNGTFAVGWGSGAGTFGKSGAAPGRLVDPLSAIIDKAGNSSVEYVLDDFAYSRIHSKAEGKDVCFAFISSRSGEGTNSVLGNHGDRNNLTAWYAGDDLVTTVASRCRNTVVVVHSVGALIVEPWISNPNVTAVVLAHLPGQESGNSLVDVLWGDVNPSGKLPYTIAKQESDYCCQVLFDWSPAPEQEFAEGLLTDYRWFDAKGITPRFEFGFGISYTTFTYGASLETTVPKNTESLGFLDTVFSVSTTITNSGSVFGKEVAQLYLSFGSAPAGTPKQQLRGFEKVSLEPGQTKELTFEIKKRDVSYWDVNTGNWKVITGSVGITVGSSSRTVKASATVNIS